MSLGVGDKGTRGRKNGSQEEEELGEKSGDARDEFGGGAVG